MNEAHEFLTEAGLKRSIDEYQRQLAAHMESGSQSDRDVAACRGAIQALTHLKETCYPGQSKLSEPG